MSQTAITVRLEPEIKSQFDNLCNEFGMSANTAFNIFVKAVVRNRCIPFAIQADGVRYDQLNKAFEQQRSMVAESSSPDLSLEEINNEIREYRKGRREGK